MPREFWLLWTASFTNRCGGFVFIVLTFFLSRERHLDAHEIGLVIGLSGAGAAFGVLLGGTLADHWGRRTTQLLAQCTHAGALLLLGLVSSPPMITAAGFLVGLGQSLGRPVLTAMLIDVVPPEHHTRAFSLSTWGNNLAFIVAAALGGWLAALDYRLVFLGDAATAVAAGLIVFLAIGETRPPPVGAAHPAAGRSPWRDGPFLALSGLTFLAFLIIQQLGSTLPLSMARDGLSAAGYGAVMSVNAVVILITQPFVPRLLHGRDLSRTIALGVAVLGVGYGLTTFAHTALFYAVTVLVWGLGEAFYAPGTSTLTAALSPTGARGRYQGQFSLAIAAAAIVAPVVGTAVLDRFGGPALWLGCLGLGLVVAALQLTARPARLRRLAQGEREDTGAAYKGP